MRFRILFALTFACALTNIASQPVWTTTAAPAVSDRYDDIYFVNKDTGWAISLYYAGLQQGKILRTYDGGNTWQTLVNNSFSVYRDIGFLDAQTGFVGTLYGDTVAGDTVCMYKTTDAGASWHPVTNLNGPKTAGICGMRVINDSTIYATGRFSGPPGFYKTTNKGLSWTYKDMSAYAKGLVDIFFFNPDTGIAVGTLGNFQNFQPYFDSCGVVLYTTDGGNTWQQVARTSRNNEICWKISFPSRNTGYISIETNSGLAFHPQYLLKTTDGGLSWQEIFLTNDGNLEAQGVGFINDSVGWIGGRNYAGGASVYTYQTMNGGATWTPNYTIRNPNRFRILSDTLGYVSGQQIYKLHYKPCIAHNDTSAVQICAGSSYDFDGQILSLPGTYTHTFSSGCGLDSIVTLQLTTTYEYSGTADLKICRDDSIYYKGKYYYEGDNFNDTITASGGCDSIVHLHVGPRASSIIYDTLCQGNGVWFDGAYRDTSGSYFDTAYIYYNGCDSVIQLKLNVVNIQNITVDTSIMQGDSLTLPSGEVVTQPGTYYDGAQTISPPLCHWIVTHLTVVSSIATMASDETKVLVYPNPATDQLFIEANGIAVNEINIYNTAGKLAKQIKQPLIKSIDLSPLSSGVYVAEIKTKDAVVKRRWVKF